MLHALSHGPITAPLLVACHGVTDSAASLADFTARLAGRFHVVAVDSLSHGFSPRWDGAGDPLAACLTALSATLAPLVAARGPAILYGHSMGGALVTRLAAEHPQWVRGIIAEDPAWLTREQEEHFAAWGPAEAARLAAFDPQAARAHLQQAYPTWPARDIPGWLAAKEQVDLALVRSGRVGYRAPWGSWGAELAVPTVFVTSDTSDCLLGPAGLARLAATGNPHLHGELLPGARHCVRREDPEAFAARIEPYLAAWSRADAS